MDKKKHYGIDQNAKKVEKDVHKTWIQWTKETLRIESEIRMRKTIYIAKYENTYKVFFLFSNFILIYNVIRKSKTCFSIGFIKEATFSLSFN